MNLIMNVLWKDNADPAGREKRRAVLRSLGVEARLKEIASDQSDPELRDKSSHTLAYFN